MYLIKDVSDTEKPTYASFEQEQIQRVKQALGKYPEFSLTEDGDYMGDGFYAYQFCPNSQGECIMIQVNPKVKKHAATIEVIEILRPDYFLGVFGKKHFISDFQNYDVED